MYFTNIELGYKLAVVPKLFVPRCYGHCFEKISQMFPASYIPCRFIELFPKFWYLTAISSGACIGNFVPPTKIPRVTLGLYRLAFCVSFLIFFTRFASLRIFLASVRFRKISKFQTSVRIIQESRVYFFFKFFSWIRRLLRTFLLKIEKFKEIYRHTDTLTYTCSCISLKSKLNYQNK